jgi:hypothetical protein
LGLAGRGEVLEKRELGLSGRGDVLEKRELGLSGRGEVLEKRELGVIGREVEGERGTTGGGALKAGRLTDGREEAGAPPEADMQGL